MSKAEREKAARGRLLTEVDRYLDDVDATSLANILATSLMVVLRDRLNYSSEAKCVITAPSLGTLTVRIDGETK